MMKKEDFLHFLWKYLLFDRQHTTTTSGEEIEVVSPGQHNTDAGPDFFNAKIRIGGTLWAGNVEIHFRASDWKRHAHHHNDAYHNVILHVVTENDDVIVRNDGQAVPAFVMTYDPVLEDRYKALLAAPLPVPCAPHVRHIQPIHMIHFLGRLLVERLELKAENIKQALAFTNNEWNAAFHQLLFHAFGFGINTAAFELLAKNTPYKVTGKHRNTLLQLEALLFGQAGMLQGPAKDEYHGMLQKEYCFLQEKFRLVPLEAHLWKFLRLRPSNFPTIRLAQLAQFLHRAPPIIHLMEAWDKHSERELYALFDLQASEYWDTHFVFGKPSPPQPKKLGQASIYNLIVNLAIPYLFTYAQYHRYDSLRETALELLEKCPPEENHILRQWQQIGVKAQNAFHSQALIQLQTAYCDKKRCLYCPVGAEIIFPLSSFRQAGG
ncbi:MAG: DUF2851 family protein [Prevotellaceae bacterium]|jgi:hypothetical protein|nr:DUF2851 family protein [Prevotellaceae bacterium]